MIAHLNKWSTPYIMNKSAVSVGGIWWARPDLNQRPIRYERGTLARILSKLSEKPLFSLHKMRNKHKTRSFNCSNEQGEQSVNN